MGGNEMRWSTVFGAAPVLAIFSFSSDALAFFGGRAVRGCPAAVKERCGHVQPRIAPLRACFETQMDHLSRRALARIAVPASLFR